MIKRLLRILQREFLDHALDTVQLRKRNRLLAIQRMSTGKSTHGSGFHDQMHAIDLHITTRRQYQQLAARIQTSSQRPNSGRIRRCTDDKRRTTHRGEPLGGVLLGCVDVLVRAELVGEIALLVAGGEGDNFVAHLGCVLDGEMAEPAEALHGNDFAGDDLQFADGVEDCDAGTEDGCVFCWVD